jgi:integrase
VFLNPVDGKCLDSRLATLATKANTRSTYFRLLSPNDFRQLEHVASYPTIKLGLLPILLTLVRKSELIHATWDDMDFEKALWSIRKERMKAARPDNVHLSQQAVHIMIALPAGAAGSRYLIPSRYGADKRMSNATLNRVTHLVVGRARQTSCRLRRSQCTTRDAPDRQSLTSWASTGIGSKSCMLGA